MNNRVDIQGRSRGWQQACLISILVLLLYSWTNAGSTLWDRDEPRYARATVEMVESGNYLYPTFNGELRPHKPILIYWVMAVFIWLLGPTAFACRLVSSVAAAGTCLLTYFIGRRLMNPRAALWSTIIVACNMMVWVAGTSATIDAVLMLLMTAAMAVFVLMQTRGPRWYDLLTMGLFLGLAQLAKGPVALLAFVGIVVAIWLDRDMAGHRRKALTISTLAAVLGTILFLAWAIPANNATGGEFYRTGIEYHLLDRMRQPLDSHGGEDALAYLAYLPYYIPVILGGLVPWTLLFPASIRSVWKCEAGDRHLRSLLAGWIVPTFVILTLVVTKLPHYILPIWPAMALALGGFIAAAQEQQLSDRTRGILQKGLWFIVVFYALLVVAVVGGPWLLGYPMLGWGTLLLGTVFATMTFLAVRAVWRDQILRSARILVVGSLLWLLPALLLIFPALEKLKLAPDIGKKVHTYTDGDIPVATYGYAEPTLTFYVGQTLEHLHGDQVTAEWMQRPGRGILITTQEIYSRIQDQWPEATHRIRILGEKTGINFARGQELDTLVLLREG